MSETTINPHSNPEAALPVINPAEVLVPNGEVQYLSVSNGIVGGQKYGGETTLPLGMLDPLASSESGFSVNNNPADLMSVIAVGRQNIGIIDTQKGAGYGSEYNYNGSRFMLANIKMGMGQDGKSTYAIEKTADGQDAAAFMNEPDTAHSIGRQRSAVLFDTIGIDVTKDALMSGRHATIHLTDEGAIKVVDRKSSNGTLMIVRPTSNPDRQVTSKEAAELQETVYRKDIVAAELGNAAAKQNLSIGYLPEVKTLMDQQVPSFEYHADKAIIPEFKIGGSTYNFVGIGERRSELVFESTNAQANKKTFVVYTSNSEGSLRASQGYEKYVGSDNTPQKRLLKGAEDNIYFQYTQDTQLHPEFEEKVRQLLSLDLSSITAVDDRLINHDDAAAQKLVEQFQSEMNVYTLGSQALLPELKAISPGKMTKEYLKYSLGLESIGDTQKMDEAVKQNIANVNAMLEKEGLIPDFTKPVRTEYSTHPVLGNVVREVYVQYANGRPVEWVMSSTTDGKVWIERIRLADTKSTSFGTDSEMLYSGVLTAKPLEYKSQTTGLPEGVKKPSSNVLYDDITGFIDMLAPVQKYRQQKQLYR